MRRAEPTQQPTPEAATQQQAIERIERELLIDVIRGENTVGRTFKLLEMPSKQALARQDDLTELRAAQFYKEHGVFCGWCGEPRSLYAAEVCSVVIDLCVECLQTFGAKLKGRRKNRGGDST